jgi:hypothetical protein
MCQSVEDHGCSPRPVRTHPQSGAHLGEGALHLQLVSDLEAGNVLAHHAGGVLLHEKVKVARNVLGRDGRVGPDDLCGT